jgi:hypothetical protein
MGIFTFPLSHFLHIVAQQVEVQVEVRQQWRQIYVLRK